MVVKLCDQLNTTHNERPLQMRLRKADLRQRVKVDLTLRFTRTGLTSYAGLELVRRYFRQLGLTTKLRRHLRTRVPRTDYGIVGMVTLVLTLLIVGGRRRRAQSRGNHRPALRGRLGLATAFHGGGHTTRRQHRARDLALM